MRSVKKAFIVGSAGVFVAVALSGCLPIADTHVAIDKAPTVGQCWTTTYEVSEHYADWGGKPAVDCSRVHQLVTFAVPTLKLVHSGALFNTSGSLKSDISGDSLDTCFDEMQSRFLPGSDAEELLNVEPFLPSEAEWDAGARWVRCDMSVLAYGSSVKNPELAALPEKLATLQSQVAAVSTQFNFCIDNPGGRLLGGPKGANAVYADCRTRPQWQLVQYDLAYIDPDAPIPYEKSVRSTYDSQCKAHYADKDHVTYPYYPSQSDWQNGDGEVECWVGRK